MKKILVLILTLALLCPCTALADDTEPVKPSGECIDIIDYKPGVAAGTPVLVVILPAGDNIIEVEDDTEENQTDIVNKLKEADTMDEFEALKVEYMTVAEVSDDGKLSLSGIKMKATLETCLCYVMVKYYDEADEEYVCKYIGRFAHTSDNDVVNLVAAFNGKTDCSDYTDIINNDIIVQYEDDGETIKSQPKNILKKNGADTEFYKGLVPQGSNTVFNEILYTLKGNTDFTITTLIDTFNKAKVWTRLCTEADTLSVLGEYNKTTFWNIEIGETSDFATLAENEKSTILNNIKTEKYTKKESLESDFEEDVVLALFRSLPQDREALEALIAENGKYASYFANARKIVADANLSTYDVTQLYNNVLENGANSLCTKFDVAESEGSVEALFKASIPTQSGDGGSDSESDDVVDMGQGSSGISNGGSGGGGGGGGIKKDPVKENEETKPSQPSGGAKTPFADVSEKHWANEYVAKLYESGAINGVSESAFNPSGSVQRQDFVKILIGALGTKLSEKKSEFADVQSGAYYESYVMTALENGFISGTGDGAFGIGSNLKREDAAVIMARVLDSYGVKTLQLGKTFNDDAQVSDYAKDAIKKVSAIGIFGGDDLGNFNPKGSLTRAEACAILCRLADAVKEV